MDPHHLHPHSHVLNSIPCYLIDFLLLPTCQPLNFTLTIEFFVFYSRFSFALFIRA